MWIWWSHIAVDHEREAREARQLAISSAAGQLSRETYASMIAVSASAHALDALYGAVKELLPNAPQAQKRWACILAVLKEAFTVRGGAGGGRWACEFEWLFGLRDAAVHFRETTNPTVPHPAGVHTGVENVMYSLEAAERAIALLLEVLDVCTAFPRPGIASVVAWATRMRPSFEDIKSRRSR
jgi:hypothetical protein